MGPKAITGEAAYIINKKDMLGEGTYADVYKV